MKSVESDEKRYKSYSKLNLQRLAMGSIESDIDKLTLKLGNEEISPDINQLMEKLTLNLTSSSNLDKDVKPLLHSIKNFLLHSDIEFFDYDLLIELLDAIVALCPFEDVLAVFSVDDLVAALESGSRSLITTVCKVISAAYPRDIFAGTPLIDELLKLYFDDSAVVSIISELEKTFDTLSTNQLNRRRILENNLPTIMNAKNSNNSTTFCRLLDLLKMLAANVSFEEFRKDTFSVDEKTIREAMENDVLVFIHICQYVCELLNLVIKGHGKEWIVRYIDKTFDIFGEAYARRDELYDVSHFANSYLLRIFSKISYLDEKSYIKNLELRYFPLSVDKPYCVDFLTVLNPSYIVKSHNELLRELNLRPRNVHMFVNLIKDEECFNIIKDEINSKSLEAMPYLEQMYLLVGLTSELYGIHHLTHNIPAIMNNLIDSGNNVTEQVCFDLRQKVFENLLDADPQELSIWLIPLQSEYSNILNGRSKRLSEKHKVADEYI